MNQEEVERIESMRETLKVLGEKSEFFYDKCSNAQVEDEYRRLTNYPSEGAKK